MLGQLVRDRTLLLMLLMFVPLLLVACSALAWDLLLRGRALRVRWLLSGLALVSGAYAVSLQWQPALSAAAAPESQARLRIVQWNTQWGGGNMHAFEGIVDTLAAQHADLIVLSEAPGLEKLRKAWSKRQAGWHSVAVDSGMMQSYWYRMVVLSRYPVQLRGEWNLARGHSALFEIAAPTGVLRALVVDLESSPFALRSPSIRQVADLVDRQPIDLVLGDFNTPAHLLGFDALAAAGGGLRRAALWSGQWRATWPSFIPVPLYDIDHVWVGHRWDVRRASFFSCRGTDHRGQVIDVQPR